MNNKYLEKLAALSEEELHRYSEAKNKVRGSFGKTLGYHTVYHGTPIDRVDHIKREGLTPNKPQSSYDRPGYVKNKVFVTKNKDVAKMFSMSRSPKSMETLQKKFEERGQPSSGKDMLSIVKDIPMDKSESKILKARIPDSHWNHMKPDPYMPRDMLGKDHSATFNHKIHPRYIGEKSIGTHLSPKNLLKYYKQNPGRAKEGIKDFASGIATVAKLGIKKRF